MKKVIENVEKKKNGPEEMLISLINVNFTFKVMFIGSIIILFITARLVKKWNVEN